VLGKVAVARVTRDANKSKATDENSMGEVIDLVKTYAKQQALDPLSNAFRWLGFGVAGAIALALGIALVLLGLLRLLQTETGDVFDGNWSFVPYVITLAVAVLVLVVAVSRIRKPTLDKEKTG
jgi:ABC-type uncharacterized transport system permease subunit